MLSCAARAGDTSSAASKACRWTPKVEPGGSETAADDGIGWRSEARRSDLDWTAGGGWKVAAQAFRQPRLIVTGRPTSLADVEPRPQASATNEAWAFKPHAVDGDFERYRVRTGDVIYSDGSAYRLSWGNAINQASPLRVVQVREVFDLGVKFALYEGCNGQLAALGTHTLPEERFMEFLRTGKVAADE